MQYNPYTPVYDPINLKEPTPTDLKIDASLKTYMDAEIKLETDEEMERRSKVLIQVEQIFLNWVRRVAIEVLHLSDDEARAAGGELFVSGSHKLGVREPGADIDTICVSPNFCTREHFFSSLKEDFNNHPLVSKFNAVETALVPLMEFDFDGVSIDLLFARLADNVVPAKLDILDDNILTGLDDATEKSLNGPRVTMMIAELVGKAAFPNFLIVLRCVRRWAKRRGLYGNKLGYLGGINCNILVAFVCQLYPKASPSTLLARFFQVYSSWQWPKPVMLNYIKPNPTNIVGKQRNVWSPEAYPFHLMPIITPAYPAMNSSEKVSKHTRKIMQDEMMRAHNIVRTIISERDSQCNIDWGRLFEPSDFFLKYNHYLACNIVGTGDDPESRSWIGFVESRILSFARYLEHLPLQHPIHQYALMSKTKKSDNSICYFIGFNIDQKLAARVDKNIHIDDCANKF
jgi:poly(A) polymerase